MTVFLREEVSKIWSKAEALDRAFALEGEVYRDVARRKTMRVELGQRIYFVKLHDGVGWFEVIKNWLQLKRPVLGAENEYEACRDLAEVGIRAPLAAAFATDDGAFASRRSFILCDELKDHTSLEDVVAPWFENKPAPLTRLRMLAAVAEFARHFHARGFIHRDFYICHLLAEGQALANNEFDLAVLDLHRARRFDVVPDRWLRRDLAALLFSTLDLGYSRRDWLRFIRLYAARPLREELHERGHFWLSVKRRADKLYREGIRKDLVKGLYNGDVN
ncbi:MAG: lipopolysaccharide core heptose(I) kinase RfaP [Pseudomonadales bacterium]|nr:lipopolysaccharide core heptose(I) kinase RfaP [Pseudomonadales bacterium]